MISNIKKAIKDPRKALGYLGKQINLGLVHLYAKILPSLVATMAQTGAHTDECLAKGALPVPIHYYSPVPDIADLKQRGVFAKKSQLKGIRFREKEQLDFLVELGKKFGEECEWPYEQTNKPEDFYLNNTSFSYGCAATLHSIIRYYRPKNVIEIGSGYSSRVISAALDKNLGEGYGCNYEIIDPYPKEITEKKLTRVNRITKERVEFVDQNIFNRLEENDILFIDSGHTVRIGGDVNFLFLDVLPALKKGVIVHIHDISLPYEYPEIYYTNPTFRVFWTEAYLLQAFLCFNAAFEILLAVHFLQTNYRDIFCNVFPKSDPEKNWGSGSFWIQKTG